MNSKYVYRVMNCKTQEFRALHIIDMHNRTRIDIQITTKGMHKYMSCNDLFENCSYHRYYVNNVCACNT